MPTKRPGYYFGTEIDGRWYRRYGQGMYSRGNFILSNDSEAAVGIAEELISRFSSV